MATEHQAHQGAPPENEVAKQQLAEEQKATEQSRKDFAERTKGKPTPTQEENDLARLGAHFHEHEPDGSDPDPYVTANKPTEHRQMEARKPASGAGYETRQATPAKHTPPSTASS
jgi:hypothetical protein